MWDDCALTVRLMLRLKTFNYNIAYCPFFNDEMAKRWFGDDCEMTRKWLKADREVTNLRFSKNVKETQNYNNKHKIINYGTLQI